MKLAALQCDIAWENRTVNFERLDGWSAQAAATGTRLVALPEMFGCGFTMATEAVEEPEDGPTSRFLLDRAKVHNLWICGSIPERPAGSDRPYNTALFAGPRGELHRYRKIHPFTGAKEHEHYAAGDARVTFDIEGVRVTPFICYDLRFADEFWDMAPATDLYLVVANWPERRRHHWSTLLRARAIENQAYVVGVNRVGRGGDLDYMGDSAIIDPWGEVLATASRDETLLCAEISPDRVAQARSTFPVLRDRR